jgi:putative addiction module component (TIGR02574 family)
METVAARAQADPDFVRALIDEVVSLPLEEQAKMADALLESMNPRDEEASTAWIELARHRLAELRSGKVASVPGETVFGRIRERYGP